MDGGSGEEGEPVQGPLCPHLLPHTDGGVDHHHHPEQGVLHRRHQQDGDEQDRDQEVEPRQDVGADDLAHRAGGAPQDPVHLAPGDPRLDLGRAQAGLLVFDDLGGHTRNPAGVASGTLSGAGSGLQGPRSPWGVPGARVPSIAGGRAQTVGGEHPAKRDDAAQHGQPHEQ